MMIPTFQEIQWILQVDECDLQALIVLKLILKLLLFLIRLGLSLLIR